MSHYAYVNPYTNQVEKVLVIEKEQIKKGSFGEPKNFKECSYTGKIGKVFPGIGYHYFEKQSLLNFKKEYYFVPPRPYLSWQFDENSWSWYPPKPYPNDNKSEYIWDEREKDWKQKSKNVSILPKPEKSYILNESYQWEPRTSFYIRKFKKNKIVKFIINLLT